MCVTNVQMYRNCIMAIYMIGSQHSVITSLPFKVFDLHKSQRQGSTQLVLRSKILLNFDQLLHMFGNA